MKKTKNKKKAFKLELEGLNKAYAYEEKLKEDLDSAIKQIEEDINKTKEDIEAKSVINKRKTEESKLIQRDQIRSCVKNCSNSLLQTINNSHQTVRNYELTMLENMFEEDLKRVNNAQELSKEALTVLSDYMIAESTDKEMLSMAICDFDKLNEFRCDYEKELSRIHKLSRENLLQVFSDQQFSDEVNYARTEIEMNEKFKALKDLMRSNFDELLKSNKKTLFEKLDSLMVLKGKLSDVKIVKEKTMKKLFEAKSKNNSIKVPLQEAQAALEKISKPANTKKFYEIALKNSINEVFKKNNYKREKQLSLQLMTQKLEICKTDRFEIVKEAEQFQLLQRQKAILYSYLSEYNSFLQSLKESEKNSKSENQFLIAHSSSDFKKSNITDSLKKLDMEIEKIQGSTSLVNEAYKNLLMAHIP